MTASITITDYVNYDRPAERQLFDLIREINEQEPPHLLQGRFKLNGNLDELMAELKNVEAEISDAARRLVRIKAAIRTIATSNTKS